MLILRRCLRPWLERKMAGNDKVQMIDQAITLNGVKIVLLIRVTPIPVHFTNLLLSATRVTNKQYIAGSAVGLLVLQVLFIYIGTTISSIAEVTEFKWTPQYIALFVIQFVAIVAVVTTVCVVGRRQYRRLVAEYEARRGAARAEELVAQMHLLSEANDGNDGNDGEDQPGTEMAALRRDIP